MHHCRRHIFHSYSFTSFHNLVLLCIHQMEFEYIRYYQHNNILPYNLNKNSHYHHYLRFSRRLRLSRPPRTNSPLNSYNNPYLEYRCSFCICILVCIFFCTHCCSVWHIFYLNILHVSCNLNLNGTKVKDQLGLVLVLEQHNNCLNNIDWMDNHYQSDNSSEIHTLHCSIYIQ